MPIFVFHFLAVRNTRAAAYMSMGGEAPVAEQGRHILCCIMHAREIAAKEVQ